MKTPKTKTKDLTPKAPARVKGGGRLVNDNIHARARREADGRKEGSLAQVVERRQGRREAAQRQHHARARSSRWEQVHPLC